MASSGFSGFNPFTKGITGQEVKASINQAAIRLLNLPDDLRNVSQATRVEGEVISKGPERTLFIRTDRGDIEVRANEARRFEIGQKVQLDIPAGKPPREALITKTDSLSQAVSGQKPVSDTSLASALEKPSVELSRQAQLQTAVLREIRETKEGAKIPPAKLSPDTLVRLTQIPRQEAAQALKIIAEQVIRQTINAVRLESFPVGQNIAATQGEAQVPAVPVSYIPQQISNLSSVPLSTAITFSEKALLQTIWGLKQETASFTFFSRPQSQALPQTSMGGITRFTPEQVQGRVFQSIQNIMQPVSQGSTAKSVEIPPDILNRLVTTSGPSGNATNQTMQIDARVNPPVPIQNAAPQWGGTIQQPSFLTQGSANNFTFRIAGITPEGFPLLSPISGQTSTNGTAPNMFLLNFPMKGAVQGQLLQMSPLSVQIFGLDGQTLSNPWNTLFSHMKETATPNPLLMSLQSLIPQANAPMKIVPSILFLFAALHGGTLEDFAGTKTLQSLKDSKTLRVLDALMKDGAASSRLLNTVSGDWRAWTFPLQYQDNMVPINLYVQNQRQEGGQDNKDADSDATRFLFEFDLTRMGLLQIDGMMREDNLDIFIRTEKEISGEMKSAMKALYLQALDKSELTGDIAFQTKDSSWVNLSQPLEKEFAGTVT